MRTGIRAATRILVALAVFSLGAPALAQSPLASRAKALAEVDAAFGAEFAADPLGSMTVAVVDHGQLIWTKSYGYADLEKKTPADRQTVYRIGSITKQFTGLALLQLAREGKVSLDDPAVKYLPELRTVQGFDAIASQVTLLSLATHRAGLSMEPSDLSTLRGPIEGWEDSVRAALAKTRIQVPPNTDASYSNIGYGALGLALENAAKTPYTELVERKIVKPLGMTSTGFRPTPDMLSHLAKGYGVRNGVPTSAASDADLAGGRGYKIPNGGLFTTVNDLARFVAFEMGYGPPGVLPRDVLAANFQRNYRMMGGGRYGVGYQIDPRGSHQLVGHSGSVAGFTSAAFFDPQVGVGVICLRSDDVGCRSEYLIRALAAIAPAWSDEAQRIQLASAARAKRFAGQKPYPRGEAVLRNLIDGVRVGKPDYTMMSDVVAEGTRQQLATSRAMLERLGGLQSVTFKGVAPNGGDIYETAFANGKLKVLLILNPDDSIEGMEFGPTP
jgi:CubicO group peptidase (beta-lactamase class C family)